MKFHWKWRVGIGGKVPEMSPFEALEIPTTMGFPVAQSVKNLPAVQETWVRSLGWEDLLEKEMATHSSILAWKIHGQRSLVGCSPWGRKELGTNGGLYTNTMDHGNSEIENARFVFSKCELSGISSLDLYTS